MIFGLQANWLGGLAKWWENLPFTIAARAQFPHSASYVVWVCYCTLHWEVFSRVGFLISSKTNIWLDLICWTIICKIVIWAMLISCIILLPEKFLQFDWLRAEVFQLNLKYLHVKITVTMVTQNHQIKWRKDFYILKSGDSTTKRKFGKPRY